MSTEEHAVDLRPLVDRRVTHLALSGSPDHTKLYYQFVAKIVLAPEENASGEGGFTLNLLIPRPESTMVPTGTYLPTQAGERVMRTQTPARAEIPTVAVR